MDIFPLFFGTIKIQSFAINWIIPPRIVKSCFEKIISFDKAKRNYKLLYPVESFVDLSRFGYFC